MPVFKIKVEARDIERWKHIAEDHEGAPVEQWALEAIRQRAQAFFDRELHAHDCTCWQIPDGTTVHFTQ